MKALAIALITLTTSVLQVSAQEKTGYVNIQEVLSEMPERAMAQRDLENYMNELATGYQALQYSYQQKLDQYTALDNSAPPAVRENLERQIMMLEQQMNDYQRTSEQLLNEKEDALLQPINDKVMASIARVAKKEGYGHVFDTQSALLFPPKSDFTSLVKKDLGL